jgi:anti-sigma regulatory factor (Ser/Thr protein kinase)
MNSGLTLRMTLPRIPDVELVALDGLTRLAAHMGISDEKVGEARILVTEAIINALEHAGMTHPSVDVEFTMTKETLVIFVKDEGKGFEVSSVEDPDIGKKLGTTHKRGWGLKLIKSMSDDFRIESGKEGTRITIVKKLS